MINILKEETPNRIYYQKHKEKIKKYQKEYHDTRKSKERMTCVCGKNIFIRNKDRHETSLCHRKYVYCTNKTH